MLMSNDVSGIPSSPPSLILRLFPLCCFLPPAPLPWVADILQSLGETGQQDRTKSEGQRARVPRGGEKQTEEAGG